jgi:hypothetical protein
VVTACPDAGTRFSVVLTKNRAVGAAIAAIDPDSWTPVRYPGAFTDSDTGTLISDAEVAEVEFTAFASTATPVTARLIVRRVRDRNHPDALFPVWRYHPFSPTTPSHPPKPTLLTEATRSLRPCSCDLINGPLAHLPSGRFAANSARAICAAIAHNLLRATAH